MAYCGLAHLYTTEKPLLREEVSKNYSDLCDKTSIKISVIIKTILSCAGVL